MKKLVSLLLAVMMLLTSVSAFADGAVTVILSTGTTQAFTADPVDEADLELILQAGLTATSAINQQPWFFAVVTNADVMAELASGGTMTAAAPTADDAASSGESAGDSAGDAAAAPAGDDASAGDSAGDSAADSAGAAAPAATTGAAKAALGDSPVAIIIYMNTNTASPDPSFDCGLACQNMVIAANALGYGTKIISSPTMTLNGAQHDALCETLGVDKTYTALAVLLLGKPDAQLDATATASQRNTLEEKVSFVK